MREKFYKLLCSYGVEDIFRDYLMKYNVYDCVGDYLNDSPKREWVGGAFVWYVTDQGYDFWSNLCDEWWRIIDER